ncbi:ubiquitin-like protein modifier (nucleomorph) [Lotharella oceanica]|uniref:Ubiquitin-like protein modifier n=1 Tax=Lotharella oceanica TaxID=641309 RepID=A0A060DFJ4_9EUKA|nr:ubiquitin-like protein modifier [Lotharella oceanica]
MLLRFSNAKKFHMVWMPCKPEDSILKIKKMLSKHTGTDYKKIKLFKNNNTLMNNMTLKDYEIHDGASLEFLII